jgi:hypothetical protein
MKSLSVEEVELLSFFEVEPSRADRDIPWPYNDYTFEVASGDFDVTFGIAPSYGDVSLKASLNGNEVYSLISMAITDLRYHKNADRETLEIVISETDSIWLRLRPTFQITQSSGVA